MTTTLNTPTNDQTPPTEDIEALLDISDEEFEDVLTEALMQANGPTSQEPDWQCLLAPEVINRTSRVMGLLSVRVQGQLSEVNSKLDLHLDRRELTATRKVRSGLLLFRSRLISRGTEAKEIRRKLNLAKSGTAASAEATVPNPPRDDRLADHVSLMERNAREARDIVRLLTLAIHQHRLSAVEAGLTPEPADRELWRTLDEVQLGLGGRSITLTEMLGTGVWTEERG
ncbi:hypothetical protein ABT369_38590 [Dactylosporangium sp. NPDC000244]|uniref:hypothetical protein n=1 Tax=Dactylosporangium sp. NPDC000244 TaxID=3154365 RepID=UPI00331822D5